jgi:hypothetical protein
MYVVLPVLAPPNNIKLKYTLWFLPEGPDDLSYYARWFLPF